MTRGREKRSKGETMSTQRRVILGWRQSGSGGADRREKGIGVATSNQKEKEEVWPDAVVGGEREDAERGRKGCR